MTTAESPDPYPAPGLYVVPGRPAPNDPADANFVIYGYVPTLGLSVLAVVWFGLALVAAIVLTALQGRRWCRVLRWETLYALMIIGLACEVVGYIFRILSKTQDPYNIADFVAQYFLIVVSPVFFAAAIYLALGRVIKGAGSQVSPLSPRAILAIFVACDVATIAVQVAGAGWLGATESSNTNYGEIPNITPPSDVLIAGLAVQTFSIAVFLVIYLLVFRRVARLRASSQAARAEDISFWKTCNTLLWVLGCAAALVELRTIFRLVEACVGFFGYLQSREVFFGTLEFLPICLAVPGLLWVGHMSRRVMTHTFKQQVATTNGYHTEQAPV